MDPQCDFVLLAVCGLLLGSVVLWLLVRGARFGPRFGDGPLPPLSPPPTNRYGELEEP